MDLLLRRYFWVVNLMVIGLCSGLIGRAASHVVEGAYLIGEDIKSSPFFRRPPPVPSAKLRGKETDEIIHRDIFCSACVPVQKGPETPGSTGPSSNEPQKTSLQIELVSTMVSDDEAWSMAVLRDLSTKEKDAEMFNRGRKIFATTAVVKKVQAHRVYLDHDGRVEYVDLDAVTPAAAAAPVVAAAGATPASEFGDLDKSIQCNGTNCTIDRALVDKALANTAALATQARLVPSMVGGKPNGFKMYAIRPSSLFAKLGMQNGDTLKQVNGNEMSTPDQALSLLTKLRSASHLSLQVERKGETVTMDYTIR